MKDTPIPSQAAGDKLPGSDSRSVILLVDDLSETRYFKKRWLEEDGYRIVEADNGREGVEVAKRERPRLILMNYLMPEMNGLKAIEIIRRTPGLEHTPIIMNSACEEEKMRPLALAAGCNDYVEEPCDIDALLEKVNLLIRLG